MRCPGLIFAALLLVSVACVASAAPAGEGTDPDCPPEQIIVRAAGDTVRVQHIGAERNCCTDLVVVFNVEGATINFFEQEVGSPCRCLCCYDSNYEAHGLSPGRYQVCVWAGDAPDPIVTLPVDVLGSGTIPVMGTVEGGVCQRTPSSKSSWGTLRLLYR